MELWLSCQEVKGTEDLDYRDTTFWIRDFALGRQSENEFHDYAFAWLPDRITWFVDGQQVREYTGGSVAIPELPTKIMMSLWVFNDSYAFGGGQGGNNQYPMHSEYDWQSRPSAVGSSPQSRCGGPGGAPFLKRKARR